MNALADKSQHRAVLAFVWAVVSLSAALIVVQSSVPPTAQAAIAAPEESKAVMIQPRLNVTGVHTVTLPLVLSNQSPPSAFGTESNLTLATESLMTRANQLGVGWVRVNGRISWSLMQPNEGDSIRWTRLASFEEEMIALKEAGLTPIIVIDDYPLWATNGALGYDGLPSHCAALRPDKMPAFAAFVRSLVARYKAPEFDVHHWELGNEPDVDPSLVTSKSAFGCWGDIDDPYYGGEQYGEMLKIVTPEIRAEDPRAVVLLGGLLLNRPHTVAPHLGRPELFLEGVLRVGAAPHFDILPYHAYPEYLGVVQDYDLNAGPWTSWGGNTLGKAAYLRLIMEAHAVDKPLSLNETGLMCSEYYTWCVPPDESFFRVQATHAARSSVRALASGVEGFAWYSLNGPGWRYTGLLDADGNPKSVFLAYQEVIDQLAYAPFLNVVDYGPELEAYAFARGLNQVQVVWSIEDVVRSFSVPDAAFVAAYGWDGVPFEPSLEGSDRVVTVGFEPVYLVLTR